MLTPSPAAEWLDHAGFARILDLRILDDTRNPLPDAAMTTSDTSDGGWVSLDLLDRCYRHFLDGWHELPDGAARRWFVAWVVGLAVAIAATAAATLGVRAWTPADSFGWEADAMRWLHGIISAPIGGWLSVLGNSLILWPVMLFAAGAYALRKRPLLALSLFPSYAVTQLIVTVGWWIWSRPAPDVLTDNPESHFFNSFPSGHTAHSIFAYGILVWLWWSAAQRTGEKVAAAVVFLVLAGAVSVGRISAGAHWPTDILASWMVGGLWWATQVVALRVAHRR